MTPSEQFQHFISEVVTASVAVDSYEQVDPHSWRIKCLDRELEIIGALSEDQTELTLTTVFAEIPVEQQEKAFEVMLVLNNDARDRFGIRFGLTEDDLAVQVVTCSTAAIDGPFLQRCLEVFIARAAEWRILSQAGFDVAANEVPVELIDPSLMA